MTGTQQPVVGHPAEDVPGPAAAGGAQQRAARAAAQRHLTRGPRRVPALAEPRPRIRARLRWPHLYTYSTTPAKLHLSNTTRPPSPRMYSNIGMNTKGVVSITRCTDIRELNMFYKRKYWMYRQCFQLFRKLSCSQRLNGYLASP